MIEIIVQLQLLLASLMSLVTQLSEPAEEIKLGAQVVESVEKYTEAPRKLRGINTFRRKDGTIFEIETSEEEYRALGLKDSVNPVHSDGIWDKSILQYVVPLNSWVQEDNNQAKLINTNGEIISLPNDYPLELNNELWITKYATSS